MGGVHGRALLNVFRNATRTREHPPIACIHFTGEKAWASDTQRHDTRTLSRLWNAYIEANVPGGKARFGAITAGEFLRARLEEIGLSPTTTA